MRFYVDTSVWGGVGDEEFAEWTIPFMEQARLGKFTLVLSDLTIKELQTAPESVRNVPATIPPEYLEIVSTTDEHLGYAMIDIRTPKEIVYENN